VTAAPACPRFQAVDAEGPALASTGRDVTSRARSPFGEHETRAGARARPPGTRADLEPDAGAATRSAASDDIPSRMSSGGQPPLCEARTSDDTHSTACAATASRDPSQEHRRDHDQHGIAGPPINQPGSFLPSEGGQLLASAVAYRIRTASSAASEPRRR